MVALLLLLLCRNAYADTQELILVPPSNTRFIESRIGGTIKVELRMKVGENIFRHYLTLPREYTVIEALGAVYTIEQGFVCYSPKDIVCINDVCGNLPDSYWKIKVNGNEQNYSSQSHLTEGDVLEVVYVQSGEPSHVSLDQWLSSYKGK